MDDKKKGGRLIPALCNIAGCLILAMVIGSCLSIVVPRLMGYNIYNVVSGSMEPEIPIGSVIYVEKTPPDKIQPDEIIAFQSGESVIVHRVVKNQSVEGTFVTKGDANAQEDLNDVGYASLIGRVAAHYPMIGQLMILYTSNVGKAYVVCFAACGAMFNILAGRIRARRKGRTL